MTKLQALLARVKVIFTAAPTYLVAASVAAVAVTEEISKILPAGAAETATRIGGVVLSILGAAIAIVRRVTPVIPDERGLLSPPKPPAPGE